ncbi:MAG: bis(5'-nucleosyl)-tetraphosphatase (symmetrical) YqeK [Muribaculaceae bacterium]|nr:bis(5'-nucleosyl)-tetraphosphatase (symmetrical) YqeK [Muribaculaceae bacterium]
MDYIKISREDLLKWLKENLNEERYEHSLGTAECAESLAETFGLDSEKAYIAGLLHDCAKCFSTEKLLSIIEENLIIDEDEKSNPKTLHAPVSAYVAETKFGVTDKEILSSIRWHTLGKLNMTDFEKVIFLADKIESRTREHCYCAAIKACLSGENALNRAMLQCYRQTIKSLVDRDLKICTATIDIYNNLQGC